jgi:hypothetical protein
MTLTVAQIGTLVAEAASRRELEYRTYPELRAAHDLDGGLGI